MDFDSSFATGFEISDNFSFSPRSRITDSESGFESAEGGGATAAMGAGAGEGKTTDR
jgi:hypothetical protein